MILLDIVTICREPNSLEAQIFAAFLNNNAASCYLQPDQQYITVLSESQQTYQFSVQEPVLCYKKAEEIAWLLYKIGELLGVGFYGEVFDISAVAQFNGESTNFHLVETHRVVKIAKGRFGADALANEAYFMHQMEYFNPEKIFSLTLSMYETFSYLVMDYLPGRSLNKILEDDRKGVRVLSCKELVLLSLALCNLLGDIQRRGFLHLDLKPENILCDWQQGLPCLRAVDFGVSRVLGDAESRVMEGTGFYMAPEFFVTNAAELCYATDLYALGIILALLWRAPALLTADFCPNRKLSLQLQGYCYEDLFSDWQPELLTQETMDEFRALLGATANRNSMNRGDVNRLSAFFSELYGQYLLPPVATDDHDAASSNAVDMCHGVLTMFFASLSTTDRGASHKRLSCRAQALGNDEGGAEANVVKLQKFQ